LLHFLLLLRVPLLQLICLLLVALLDLLPAGFIRILSGELRVLFILLLLKFLPVFLLLRVQLFLLLLIFLVELGVAGVWRSGTLGARQLVRVDRGWRSRDVVCPARIL
jgi:hypothetical protein